NVIQDFQENYNDELDERSSEEYLEDLEIEYHERALLKDYKAEYKKMKVKLSLLEASPSSSQNPKTFQPKNKGLVDETFNWDEEEVSGKEEVTQVKVLMALADNELTVVKNHARNDEWVNITMRKDGPFQAKTAEGDTKPEFQWTPDERRVVVQDQYLKSIIMSCLPDDIMESVISCVSARETWTDLVHNFEGPSDTKENMIMDLKLEYQTFRAKSTESLSQTYTRYKTLLNELTNDGVNLSKHKITVGFINNYKAEYKKMKVKLSLLEASPSSSQNPKTFQPKNKGLVDETFNWDEEEVSGKEEVTQVKVLMALADNELTVVKNHARNDEWVNITMRKRILYCMLCKREDHRTSDHEMYIVLLKRSKNYKSQPYQYASSSKQILKVKEKPFPPCTHCGFDDHRHGDCRTTLSVKSVEAIITLPQDTIMKKSQAPEVIMSFIKMVENQNDVKVKQIRTDNRTRERIPDISYFHVFRCPVFIHNNKDHLGKFDAKANDGYFLGYSFVSKAFRVFNKRRQQVEETYHVTFDQNYDVSYYIIPYGCSLTELTQENYVPEAIAHNEPEIPHTKDTEGSGSITEPLVPDVTQSHISNKASPSSYPAPHDRWSRDQHIKLVNIIGNPGEGMLTRSMATKISAASASECLFAYFLFEIEPKKDDNGISICQEQYTKNLLKKYEISDSSSVKTPMVPLNNLSLDLAGKLVNETSYRGMIGSLMYLTVTRPDI
nr:retrovirus-related Pol polyprotein from transposon TNT 1-94 [Tanacetum cinerariifolium]